LLLPQLDSTELGHSEPAFSPQVELSRDERTQRSSVALIQSCVTSWILDTWDVFGIWGWFHNQGCLIPVAFPALPVALAPIPSLFWGKRKRDVWESLRLNASVDQLWSWSCGWHLFFRDQGSRHGDTSPPYFFSAV